VCTLPGKIRYQFQGCKHTSLAALVGESSRVGLYFAQKTKLVTFVIKVRGSKVDFEVALRGSGWGYAIISETVSEKERDDGRRERSTGNRRGVPS
jgi:hypothetical protein